MGKMIYSILKAAEDPGQLPAVLSGMRGISNADFHEVSYDDITAVVCDVQKASLVTDRSATMDYAGVIDSLFKDFTLLPVRFGSVMESEGEIRNISKSR